VNRRYIAALAVAALLTLVAGLFVRQQLQPATPAPVAPPSEASAFQQLSEEAQARRLSSFLSERATDVAALVEYVNLANASGIRWRTGDTLITSAISPWSRFASRASCRRARRPSRHPTRSTERGCSSSPVEMTAASSRRQR